MTQYCTFGLSAMPVDGKKATIKEWNKKPSSDLEKMLKKKGFGTNVAIRTGAVSNCMVVDVDVKNSGLAVWEKLEAKYGKIDTYRVKTPSGGLHIYLDYQGTAAISNSVSCITYNLLKVGIDTRNDNGYVVAPPSTAYTAEVPLLQYHKTRGERALFEPMPMWLSSLLVGNCVLDVDYNIALRAVKEVEDITESSLIVQGINLGFISALLACIKTSRLDDRNTWRDIVYGLKNASVQYKIKDKEMRALAVTFSKRYEKYDNGSKRELDLLWDDETTNKKKITLGTIRFMAREDDPNEYAAICKGISFEGATDITPTSWNDQAAIRTSQPTLAKLMQFYKGCVFEVNNGTLQYFARMRDGRIQAIQKPFVAKGEDFDIPLSPEGSIKLRTAFESLSCSAAWKRNINCFDKVDFLPSFEDRIVQDGVLNLFTSFPCKPIAGESADMQLVEWHLKNILCAGDSAYWEMMQNWLAHFVQRPGVKIEIMPMFLGEQGTGKSIVFDKLFPLLVSHDYYHEIDDMNTLFDKFNADQEKKMICVLNEIGTYGKDHGQSGKLKSVMTRKKMKVEHKGLNRYEVSDTCNFILATNKDNPVKIETSNRRYAPITVSSEKLGDLAYFTKLDAAINHDSVSQLLYKWLNRDISKWVKGLIPKTDALVAMKTLSFSPVVRFMIDIASLHVELLTDNALRIHSSTLFHEFKAWCTENNEPSSTQQKVFSAELIKMKIPYGLISIDCIQKRGFSIKLEDLQILIRASIREPDWDFTMQELVEL